MKSSDNASSNAANRAHSGLRRGPNGFGKRVPDRTADGAAEQIVDLFEDSRLEILVVDEDGSIVRPTLTIAVDAYSRAILGVHITPG